VVSPMFMVVPSGFLIVTVIACQRSPCGPEAVGGVCLARS
jgi:hypothetical protein